MKATTWLLVTVVLTAGRQTIFAADSDLSKLAAANNAFSFKLLKQLATEQPGASIFVSPYSAATALQMAANGAAGQTKTEMQQVLETSGQAAVPLNPGIINTAMLRSCFGGGAKNYPAADEWAKTAVPFLLKLNAANNGEPLTVQTS
jgi:hypothetical protein